MSEGSERIGMLNLAVRNTAKLVRERSKSENVRLGRLFTKKDTARLMAESFLLDENKTAYTVLDPGAGTGILTAAIVEEICKRAKGCRQIFATCYENDPVFLPMLEDNLERIRKKCRHDYGVRLFATVYKENYVTDSANHYTVTFFDTVADKYDLIICNPPKEMCEKASSEALSAGGVTQVKINSAFLFLSMAERHLEDGGQLVIMLPTSYASASQLTSLRKKMLTSLAVKRIHLFIAKQKNAKRAVPLKKNFIVHYAKCAPSETMRITTSLDHGAEVTELPRLAYSFVVDPESGAFTLPKSVEDTKIVGYISAFPETLSSLGLRVSTGLVIESKCKGMIFSEPLAETVPLIRQGAMRNGAIEFPSKLSGQYLAPMKKALMQKNKNMIIIKRVPAKSDERFVNASIYLAAQLPEYKYISTHNKINFIDTKNRTAEMCPRLTFGLFALLNSTIYDRYISIVSKSGQINAKELKKLPLPPRHVVETIGVRLMELRRTSVRACDQVVNPILHIIEK